MQLRNDHLHSRNIAAQLLGIGLAAVQAPGGLQQQKTRLVNGHACVRNPVLHIGEIGQGMAKAVPFACALAGQRQGQFALADAAHAVVDAPRPQTHLRHHKSCTRLAQQCTLGQAYVLQQYFAMPFRRHMVEHGNVAQHVHARRIHGHQHQAMLMVALKVLSLAVGVAAHQDEQSAVGVGSAGDKPFAPVKDQGVALTAQGGLQTGRVGGGRVGLAHGKGRAHLPQQQRLQPLGCLRW